MSQAALASGRIELTHLIAGLGAVPQRLISMCKSFRHIERALIIFAQFNLDVLEIGRTLGTKIDDDVENRSPRAAHELALRRRGILKVHPSEGTLLRVKRHIGLGNDASQPVRLKFLLAKRTRKEPSRIFSALKV